MINLITYAISTVLTYILGLLSKKFKWNETLPIPIQNIIVAILTFSIIFIIAKINGTQIEAENILEQIIVALGGAGTATLAYDTDKATIKGDDDYEL